MLEVECKFALVNPAEFAERIVRVLNATFVESIEQVDEYFDHRAHDFARTDEALRIRSVLRNGECVLVQLCYKGPRLDQQTKTRAELECELGLSANDRGQQCSLILKALGFSSEGIVAKQRDVFSFPWEHRDWCLAIDHVEGLGHFVELETLCEESDRIAATRTLQELAERLELGPSIRESYLELLFA